MCSDMIKYILKSNLFLCLAGITYEEASWSAPGSFKSPKGVQMSCFPFLEKTCVITIPMSIGIQCSLSLSLSPSLSFQGLAHIMAEQGTLLSFLCVVSLFCLLLSCEAVCFR